MWGTETNFGHSSTEVISVASLQPAYFIFASFFTNS